MSRPAAVRFAATLMLVAACALPSAGCDLLDPLSGLYRGPSPVAEGISGEEAIVRRVSVLSGGSVFIIDRVRYVQAGDPHNINRVAEVATTEATRDAVAELNLQRGDRVIVTTTFHAVTEQVGSMSIPDWPAPGVYEYPIGFHYITSIRRAGN
ncbi:MAG TPA: hypothetical protein VEY93_08680 [Longimicrobium sp.]|nr:hypothetical protein [Longimicrobium sp.]